MHRIDAAGKGGSLDHAVARAIDVVEVVTITAAHAVGAEPAVQRVVAAKGCQRIVAGKAMYGVITGGADQNVFQGRAGEVIDRRAAAAWPPPSARCPAGRWSAPAAANRLRGDSV